MSLIDFIFIFGALAFIVMFLFGCLKELIKIRILLEKKDK